MKQIIVINGEAGAGKDLFVELCKDVLGSEKVLNISTITPIKEMAAIAGWDGEKTPETRKFLSDLKDLCEKTFNTSYIYVEKKIEDFKNSDAEFIFIHSREPEQIARFCEDFGAKALLIRRKGYKNEASNHADANVYDYVYDYTVINPGDDVDLYKEIASAWLNATKSE